MQWMKTPPTHLKMATNQFQSAIPNQVRDQLISNRRRKDSFWIRAKDIVFVKPEKKSKRAKKLVWKWIWKINWKQQSMIEIVGKRQRLYAGVNTCMICSTCFPQVIEYKLYLYQLVISRQNVSRSNTAMSPCPFHGCWGDPWMSWRCSWMSCHGGLTTIHPSIQKFQC